MTFDTPEGKVSYDVSADGSGVKATVAGKDGKQAGELSTKVDQAVFEGLVYAGATSEGEQNSVRLKTAEGETNTAHFVTNDSVEKVSEHYKKLLPEANVMAAGPITYVSGKTKSGSDFSIQITAGDEGKTILIYTVHRKS